MPLNGGTGAVLNAWIPVASALVSAAAVLLAGVLANRQAHRMKLLEIESDVRRQDREKRLEVGEQVYAALQQMAKFNANGGDTALEMLDGKIKIADGLKTIRELSAKMKEIDTIKLRYQLETYFPDIHDNGWTKFQIYLQNLIDLNVLLQENLPLLHKREGGEVVQLPDYEAFRKMPGQSRDIMHLVCKQLADQLRS